MRIDLSWNIHEALEAARERAAELRAAGRTEQAAAVYREAAGLARRYASYATGGAERARRLKLAGDLEATGAALSRGSHTPDSAPKQSPDTAPEERKDDDELRDQIEGLIVRTEVSWADIGGLEGVKRQIRLAFGLAVARRPAGVRIDAVRTVLLYGPPGTGKSMLASAVSNGLDATFFSVRASNLLSKWFGESPRLVSTLYAVARERAPSVVFMDELEALFPSRGSATTGPERRVLSTLLAEISGVGVETGRPVFTIGATNAPWLMDEAAVSRFGRRVYVPLPDADARRAVLEVHLTQRGHAIDFPLSRLVEGSAGFSARQLAFVAACAVEAMIADANPELPGLAGGTRSQIAGYELKTRPLTWGDFQRVLAGARPDTPPESVRRFESW